MHQKIKECIAVYMWLSLAFYEDGSHCLQKMPRMKFLHICGNEGFNVTCHRVQTLIHNNSNNVLHKYLYLFNKNEQRKEKKCERALLHIPVSKPMIRFK